MYENLLRLPYFQGMSRNDLTSILDKVKLEFSRIPAEKNIIARGDKCDAFCILINGSIISEAEAPDGSYKLQEEHTAPYALEPYSLFGPTTEYRRNYRSKSECDLLTISKSYFFSEFTKHNIFTINLLNLISRHTQSLNNNIWENTPESLEGRIAQFVALRAETRSGAKTLHIKMERLASLLCETRINISRALNNLQERGCVRLSRKEIHIPDLALLSDSIEKTMEK